MCMMDAPVTEGWRFHDKWELSSQTNFRSKNRVHVINGTRAEHSFSLFCKSEPLTLFDFFHIYYYVMHFSVFAPSEVKLGDTVIRKRKKEKKKHVCLSINGNSSYCRWWLILVNLSVIISVFSLYTACGMPRPQLSSDVCPPSVHFKCCHFPFLRHGVTFKPPDMHVSIWK